MSKKPSAVRSGKRIAALVIGFAFLAAASLTVFVLAAAIKMRTEGQAAFEAIYNKSLVRSGVRLSDEAQNEYIRKELALGIVEEHRFLHAENPFGRDVTRVDGLSQRRGQWYFESIVFQHSTKMVEV